MSKVAEALKLSSLSGGLNRFVSEATPDQCIEAFNVYEREGDLVRRPAYIHAGMTAPYLLPHGACVVVHEAPLLTFTAYVDRALTIAYNQMSGVAGRIWVGCTQPFDGLYWQNVSAVPTAANATNNAQLIVSYLNAGGRQNIYGVYDTTRKPVDASSSVTYKQPLCQNGYIAWDKRQFNTWIATTLPGTSVGGTMYWVEISVGLKTPMRDEASTLTAISLPVSSGSITIAAPGIRAFLLNPVNGLHPVRSVGRSPVLISGADFTKKRILGPGGGLAFSKRFEESPETARLVEDEGSGINGQYAAPNWSGTTTNVGTASILTKDDQSYPWNPAQFTDSFLNIAFAPAQNSAAANQVDTGSAAATDPEFQYLYEGCTILCVAKGAGGTPIGEGREIVSVEVTGGRNILTCYDAFSIAPDTNNTFVFLAPPFYYRTREGATDYRLSTNAAYTATPVPAARPFSRAFVAADSNLFVNFEIFKDCFQSIVPGVHWCAMFDSITRHTLITNGRNGIFDYDGIRLRKLTALSDEANGVMGADLVSVWRGVVRDLTQELNDPQLETGQQVLRNPPDGDFIVDYNGRIVVAKDQNVRWSAPGIFNAIWPLSYTANIRDSRNDPITGMRVLGDRLAVFTQTSIHLSGPITDRGEIPFQPAALGIGFVSHFAVDNIAFGDNNAVLMGVSPDGIKAFDGAVVQDVLDDWKRILPYGVNARCLYKAVACAWKQRGLFLAAVPSAGSDINDVIIVVDYNKRKAWLWSAPVIKNANTPGSSSVHTGDTVAGIVSIASQLDDTGLEQILLGLDNGMIATFAEALHDFNYGYVIGSARSKPVESGDHTFSARALLVSMQSRGTNTTHQAYVSTLFNQSDRAVQNGQIVPEAVPVDAVYGTHLYDTALAAAGAQYAGDAVRTYRLPATFSISKGESFSFEFTCSGRFRFCGAELLFETKGQRGF